MAFERGFLNKRVTILSRTSTEQTDYGRKGGMFVPVLTIWANCTYTKGVKAMAEGAMDAYETYMVRCDWHERLQRECRLSWDNRIYQITSCNSDKERNEMQIVCTEIVSKP